MIFSCWDPIIKFAKCYGDVTLVLFDFLGSSTAPSFTQRSCANRWTSFWGWAQVAAVCTVFNLRPLLRRSSSPEAGAASRWKAGQCKAFISAAWLVRLMMVLASAFHKLHYAESFSTSGAVMRWLLHQWLRITVLLSSTFVDVHAYITIYSLIICKTKMATASCEIKPSKRGLLLRTYYYFTGASWERNPRW